MEKYSQLEHLSREYGLNDFKWIEPEEIVVAQWVRMKCMFGCPGYGSVASCPPNVPSVKECEQFFREYKHGIIFHFERTDPNPDTRHAWSKPINDNLLKLEREVFLKGYQKTFLFAMSTCSLCDDCSRIRIDCHEKMNARPTLEAFAVDVYTTVRQLGYPIEVLSDYGKTMNRYALLLIE
jgi:predicted metal-binding protein